LYDLFGSLSQFTVPSLETLMNLYCTEDPAAMFNLIVHVGLLDVYDEAERARALLGFQLPNCAVFPAILIVSPGTVALRSVKLTDTAVGHAVPVGAAVVVWSVVGVLPLALARRTMGLPLLTVTQTWPLPSDVIVLLLPLKTSVHLPLAFWLLKQC
jgi:hypothetical protein